MSQLEMLKAALAQLKQSMRYQPPPPYDAATTWAIVNG